MTTFATADELGEHMMNGASWVAVVAADSWPYIVTCTADGDWFVQGFPIETEEGDAYAGEPVESGNAWLEAKPPTWWPVLMLADSDTAEVNDWLRGVHSETHDSGSDRG